LWVEVLGLALHGDSCITQFEAQGPSRICNESKEEEGHADAGGAVRLGDRFRAKREHLKKILRFSPESQGRNLVLTVLYVLVLTAWS